MKTTKKVNLSDVEKLSISELSQIKGGNIGRITQVFGYANGVLASVVSEDSEDVDEEVEI
jgi:natural product precursor